MCGATGGLRADGPTYDTANGRATRALRTVDRWRTAVHVHAMRALHARALRWRRRHPVRRPATPISVRRPRRARRTRSNHRDTYTRARQCAGRLAVRRRLVTRSQPPSHRGPHAARALPFHVSRMLRQAWHRSLLSLPLSQSPIRPHFQPTRGQRRRASGTSGPVPVRSRGGRTSRPRSWRVRAGRGAESLLEIYRGRDHAENLTPMRGRRAGHATRRVIPAPCVRPRGPRPS